MRISDEIKLDFDDVLIVPKRSEIASRQDVDLFRDYGMEGHSDHIGICASNMHTTGSFEMAKAMASNGMLTALSKHYSEDELISFFTANMDLWDSVFYTVGLSESDRSKLDRVANGVKEKLTDTSKKFPLRICLDIANGYTQRFLKEVEYYANKYPHATIMAGNVCTPEMTEALILAGAKIVKIGIGSGANCLTRSVTGVGYPQLSAIIECSDAAHGLGGHIMSDGGCRQISDVCKAFAAGADFVMLGGMLAAHDECNGKTETVIDGVPMYSHYGMSSDLAMEKHGMGKNSYRASEGRETLLPGKGPVQYTLNEIMGGLRSCCAYIGAGKIKHMPKCAHFIRCNSHSQLNTSLSHFTQQGKNQ